MIPYLLFFCVAGIPAMFHSRHRNAVLWAIAWLVYVLFIGLRHEVGGDWNGYLIITERIAHSELLDAISDQEIFFSIITWISARLGFGVYGANLLGAMVFCTGLFSFCNRLPNRWLALAAATPFLAIVAVMSANRQGMAIGVLLFVMARWREWGIGKRAIGIIIASGFHNSALLMLVLVALDLGISRTKKLVATIVIAAIATWLASRSESAWYRYTTVYVNESYGAYSPGAVFHLLLNLVPAVLMLLTKNTWRRMPVDWVLLWPLCWMTIGLLFLSPFYTVAVGRMSLYLFPVSISFVATLPQLSARPEARAVTRTLLVCGLGGVLALWLGFANTAFTYMPYANALVVPTWKLDLPR